MPLERKFPDPCAYLRCFLFAAGDGSWAARRFVGATVELAGREFSGGNLFTPPGPLEVIRKTHQLKENADMSIPRPGSQGDEKC